MGSPHSTDGAQVILVIRTKLLVRGKGTKEDPVRVVEQYWSLDGEFLAENDPVKEKPDGERRGKHT